MKVCFPAQHDEGIESKVYNHFGSAPLFLIVDSDTGVTATTRNGDQHHVRGRCNPLQALAGRKIDVVIVGGIGAGALTRLNQAGIKVLRAQLPTIKENLGLFQSGKLPEFTVRVSCPGHGKGGCAH